MDYLVSGLSLTNQMQEKHLKGDDFSNSAFHQDAVQLLDLEPPVSIVDHKQKQVSLKSQDIIYLAYLTENLMNKHIMCNGAI